MKTALITGASSGIGLELAKIFAANGCDLVMVARSLNKMEKLKMNSGTFTKSMLRSFKRIFRT